jgi:hypothetical protein
MLSSNSWRSALSSRNPFVRKAAEGMLRIPTFLRSFGVRPEDLHQRPPVLINSIPKSGTHLLLQVVEGLPDRTNYGRWVASMTSSFRFRERSVENLSRRIRGLLPGEVVRGHLFYHSRYVPELAARNVVNYFIYRDPRAVALSGAHYARSMNRWHRLHRYFRGAKTMDEAIRLAIVGLQPPVAGVDFPDVGQRFGRYRGWIGAENCFAIRYEDLQSDARPEIVRQMAEFYAARTSAPLDVDACVAAMLRSIEPSKSHTFRSGEKAGWRKAFTPEHRRLFHQIAGDLLIELGYEKDDSWVESPQPAVP